MSRLKKVVIGGIIQPRVAYHIPTDQLGYCLPGTFLTLSTKPRAVRDEYP